MLAGLNVDIGHIILPNAKLSYPDQASKLWSDVDGEEKRS